MTRAAAQIPGGDAPVVDRDVASAYVDWLGAGAPGAPAEGAYYTEARARFEARDADVLRTPGDVRVGKAGCGASVASERARAAVEVCGVQVRDAERVVAAIDGARTAAEVRRHAAIADAAWSALLGALFGTVVFAPAAVAALEARAPSAEIVRFPGSPYEIVRPYWENVVEVRERLGEGALDAAILDTAAFVRLLRELHAAVLVGTGASFYRPASPIAAKERFAPGELATDPVVTEAGPEGAVVRFVSGLRVNASPLGGPHYVPLLLERAPGEASGDGVLGALDAEEASPGAAPWGAVLLARADADERAAPWFCPPRPLTAAHFDALRAHLTEALRAARAGDRAGILARVAVFHRAFVRLHPFGFANQCLAMALVNRVLCDALGAGMPHLVLDHLALQLPAGAYAAAFGRAVSAWLPEDPDPVHRTLELAQKKVRCFGFMSDLSRAETREEARRLLRERGEDARLALL